MPSKSYWQEAYIGSERAKNDVKSWFGMLADGLTPYRADILCDIRTDREKKIRSWMTDADNKHFVLERTLGAKTFSISCKPLPASKTEAASDPLMPAQSNTGAD